MVKMHKYGSGLRLVVHTTDFIRSVSVGVYAAAGSAFERAENNGISHFTEHMLFKGTKSRTAFEIAESIDRIGGQINAFTAKESTCYYTKSVTEYFEYCVNVLADIIFNSTFEKAELEREKNVVVEEISMQEDSPEDLCHETLSAAFFDTNPLAMSILGTPDTVNSFTADTIRAYMRKRYCAANMVIAIVGNIDFERAVDVIGNAFEAHVGRGGRAADYAPVHIAKPRFLYREKKIEQANIALAFPCCPFNDKRSFSASLFSTVFGGGMSSRLFQRIREKQGLAYSVYSYVSSYKNNGLFTVFLGTNPANTEKALTSVKAELELFLKEGINESEFDKGKAQVKGSFIMGQESPSAVMNACGKLLLLADEVYDMDERLRCIDAVTNASVMESAREIIDFSQTAGSIIGPQEYEMAGVF